MKLDRHKWIGLFAIAVVAGGTLWFCQGSKEPRYQGKTVRQWVNVTRPNKTFHTNGQRVSVFVDYNQKEILRMLDALGSNAAPALIQVLDHADSRLTKFKTTVARTKWVPASIRSATSASLMESLETPQIASHGIRYLGPRATAVIPDLERIIGAPDKPMAAFPACNALDGFSTQALPVLRRLLTNAPLARRQMVQTVIQRIYRQALRSENASDREEAALALSEYSRPPTEIIHVLLDILESPDPKRQKQSLDALAIHLPTMAPVLIAARDALAKAAASSDPGIRQQANKILADLKRFDSKQTP